MKSIMIVTPVPVKTSDLIALVEELDGEWQYGPGEPASQQGCFDRLYGTVWVEGDTSLDPLSYDPEWMAKVRNEFKIEPRSVLQINVGSRADSDDLADAVAQAIIDRFGGHKFS